MFLGFMVFFSFHHKLCHFFLSCFPLLTFESSVSYPVDCPLQFPHLIQTKLVECLVRSLLHSFVASFVRSCLPSLVPFFLHSFFSSFFTFVNHLLKYSTWSFSLPIIPCLQITSAFAQMETIIFQFRMLFVLDFSCFRYDFVI